MEAEWLKLLQFPQACHQCGQVPSTEHKEEHELQHVADGCLVYRTLLKKQTMTEPAATTLGTLIIASCPGQNILLRRVMTWCCCKVGIAVAEMSGAIQASLLVRDALCV